MFARPRRVNLLNGLSSARPIRYLCLLDVIRRNARTETVITTKFPLADSPPRYSRRGNTRARAHTVKFENHENRILKHGFSHCGGHYLHSVDNIPFSSRLRPPRHFAKAALKFTSRMPEGRKPRRRFRITTWVVKHGTNRRKRERERDMRFHPNDALKIFHSRGALALFLVRRFRPFYTSLSRTITRAKTTAL